MTITLHRGDCLDALASMEPDSIDAVVCDPPYHFTSIVKRFGKSGSAGAKSGQSGVYERASRGFMGKEWDGGDIAFRAETWAAVMRAMKPGAHLVAFGAPKNFGFMQVAMAEAGLECRDVLAWMFGTGFPKSHNLKGEWEGWGSALKPAYEPILLCRNPMIGTTAANIEAHGVGALNIDGCRVGTNGGSTQPSGMDRYNADLAVQGYRPDAYQKGAPEAPKPAGRWPANVVHDGSGEVLAAFPEAPGQQRAVTGEERSHRTVNAYGDFGCSRNGAEPRGDSGSAARFFYSAEASKSDRAGSKHPTVKPVALMRWLVRMVTPPGGTILDPFAGTGTSGQAAFEEGFSATLIEREAEYQADISRRMISIGAWRAEDVLAEALA